MAKQTINIGASPNDGTGTPLRTAFDYTNQNFTELYTATGPSGNNIVVPGSATITGDLTVDTSTLKVDSANNRVGIGTASPAVTLDAVSAAGGIIRIRGGSGTNQGGAFYVSNSAGSGTLAAFGDYANVGGGTPDVAATVFTASAVPLRFDVGATEKMRIASDGICTWSNVGGVAGTAMTLNANGLGIGVTPSAWGGTGVKVIDVGAAGSFAGSAADVGVVGNAYYNGSSWIYKTSFFSGRYAYALGTGQHQWFTAASGTAGNAITFTQAMTLAASGALLIGQTTAGLDAQGGFWLREASSAFGSSIIINHRTAVGTGNSYAEFTHNGIGIGSITQNGTTGVLYNINSDYRLKESVATLSGGLARVNALKPSIYKWKSDGSNGEGFLAHELAEVVPFAVTGEKDAVNEDGSIKSQGIDMSRIVPILVAAIQELTARVQTLEAK